MTHPAARGEKTRSAGEAAINATSVLLFFWTPREMDFCRSNLSPLLLSTFFTSSRGRAATQSRCTAQHLRETTEKAENALLSSREKKKKRRKVKEKESIFSSDDGKRKKKPSTSRPSSLSPFSQLSFSLVCSSSRSPPYYTL